MFFLWLIILLIVLIIGIITSCLKLEIENLKFRLPKVNGKIANKGAKIKLKIYLYKVIKILDIDIGNIKIKNEKLKNKIRNVEINFTKNNFDLELFHVLKDSDCKLEKLELKICLGTEDAALTAIIVGIIWSVISNLLKNMITDFEKQKYYVEPIYQDRNLLKIDFNGIFKIEMRNIINIMIKNIKTRRVKRDGRTSNRRAYVYGNE